MKRKQKLFSEHSLTLMIGTKDNFTRINIKQWQIQSLLLLITHSLQTLQEAFKLKNGVKYGGTRDLIV